MEFLPVELGAWNSSPIRINRLSPLPDPEAEFLARPDPSDIINDFIQEVSNNRNPPAPEEAPEQQDTLQLAERATDAATKLCQDPAWQSTSPTQNPPPSRQRIPLTPLQPCSSHKDRPSNLGNKRKFNEHQGKENCSITNEQNRAQGD